MSTETTATDTTEPAPRVWGERYDAKQGKWVSAQGYEVCQDHTGPRETCPYNHRKRRP